jgi:hypothetical protein
MSEKNLRDFSDDGRQTLPPSPTATINKVDIRHYSDGSLARNTQLFNSIQTKNGSNVGALSEYHRVVIVAINSLSSLTPQCVISKLAEMQRRMLCVNTITVIAHNLNDKAVKTWFKKQNFSMESFLFAKINEDQRSDLTVGNSIVNMWIRNDKSSSPPRFSLKKLFLRIQSQSDVGMYVVESCSMVRQFLFEKLTGFELFESYIHTAKSYTGFLEHDMNISNQIGNLYRHLSSQDLNAITCKISQSSMDICFKHEVEYSDSAVLGELYEILEIDSKKLFFTKYATTQNCTEGIYFYDEVCIFKKLIEPSAQIRKANEIFRNYVTEEGAYQINTRHRLVEEVGREIRRNHFHSNLFDSVLREMVANTLFDVYCRFKNNETYDLMVACE